MSGIGAVTSERRRVSRVPGGGTDGVGRAGGRLAGSGPTDRTHGNNLSRDVHNRKIIIIAEGS